MENKKNARKPEEVAWELFEKTGKPCYYSLYKRLKGIE
jgi:hypothetical protein